MTEKSQPGPREFQFYENENSLYSVILRKALSFAFGQDIRLPNNVIDRYAASYYEADPVAEKFIEEVFLQQSQEAGRHMVDQALAQGVESLPSAPQSLRQLFEEIETKPPWYDAAQVKLGASVFRRYGTHMYSFAGAITLHGYRENSVAKPLAYTGAYTGQTANKRFLETAAFWRDVSSDHGLDPGGAGIATAMRVRLMHVIVRKKLMQHPGWRVQEWGVPISQGDAILTLMGGSFVPGYGLRLIGYLTSREEIEAMMHFWRYVGYLMGVQPAWYPANVVEAAGLMYTAEIKGIGASGDDGRNLALSYLDSYRPVETDAWDEALKKYVEYQWQVGYTSLFVPPWTYYRYGMPEPGLRRILPFLEAPLILAGELAGKINPAIRGFLDKRASASSHNWIQARLGTRKADYRAVEEFTR